MAMAACAACFSASAATTAVNAQGGGDGSERCLVGVAGLCAGGTYNGAFSLINVFERDLGLGPFVRVTDDDDSVWANSVSGGGQVQALARYAGNPSTLGFDAGGGYIGLTNSPPDGRVLVTSASAYSGDTRPADADVCRFLAAMHVRCGRMRPDPAATTLPRRSKGLTASWRSGP